VSRRPVLLAAIAALLAMASLPIPAGAVSPTACRIRNVSGGGTYSTIADALAATAPGDTWRLRGRCYGQLSTPYSFTIRGERTARSGPPTIHGGGVGPVVIVNPGGTLDLVGVTVRGGAGFAGGLRTGGAFVYSGGTLRLTNATITDNSGEYAGGVQVQGALVVRGSSAITSNRATTAAGGAGGILGLGGTIAIGGTSRVAGNDGPVAGGIVSDTTLRLSGASRVSSNVSDATGGIDARGVLILTDDARVSGNSSRNPGGAGGVLVDDGPSVVGLTCGRGKRVAGNDPLNCIRY